ncbi:DUF4123 domain-containing protein [Roseibium sediminis]|uniref:DUF4123 domain-containing protein n=1 Tax=Roseibium sediminis TaxID=1775174 RepID=UPI00123DD7FD|nr:DUF4123 domain-containing protein [Roseibium sediminis]
MDENTLRLFEELKKEGTRVGQCPYLILDGAWQKEMVQQVRKSEFGWEPLLFAPGEDKNDAHQRSPLLVDLGIHEHILNTWLEDTFKQKLGIVVFSGLELAALRTSLKRFLSILSPETGKPVFLRFYDARTLYCFLRHGFPEQWADFFRDISVIAAPYDYSPGWTVYKPVGDTLTFGIEKQDRSGWYWRTWQNKDRAVEHYKAAFPFRSLGQAQYDEMKRCTELGFQHEIMDFLVSAFPQQTKFISREELLEFVSENQKIAIQQGFAGEDCEYYWVVLAFMCGIDFYEGTYVSRYLGIPWFSREKRLTDILELHYEQAKNPEITRLLAG